MRLIYGTGNQAKISYMKRNLQELPIEIIGLREAAEEAGVELPEIDENG